MQNWFCQNFVKCPSILIIFGRKMAKRLRLCKVHSFSPNLRHHTTVLNADVPNCYTTLYLLVLDCSYLHHQLNRRRHMIWKVCGIKHSTLKIADNNAFNPSNLCTVIYSREATNAASRFLRHPWEAANRTFPGTIQFLGNSYTNSDNFWQF